MNSSRVMTPRRNHRTITGLAFRRVRLTIVGWAALLAPGAAAGAVLVAATSAKRPAAGQLITGIGAGALTGVLIGRAVDEVQWRRSAVSLSVDEPDAALDLMQAVRAEGVRADMVRSADAPYPAGRHYALRYRAKDDRRVRAMLAEQQR